ncbi:MAG TPA: alpha-amylase family glycosyl hydrolase [Gaiellaceae bacterium]|nr:alpha-amylase family glycosyl hydrolase [Gaiellaceae bacterium]
MRATAEHWWQRAVVYQVYPRSYADSNADGVGDLAGLRARLDHLEWLGIDAVWLSPTFPSPDDDFGYDVADYRDVHPLLGTLEGMDALIADAGARGIRILLDLVPNHTSSQHPWFLGEHRDWYVWADPAPDGGPPNNWKSVFGGSAWEWSEPDGRFYLHNFLPSMPDLDWWEPGVRAEFEDLLRFWFDHGVAGFRIDVAHALFHDRHLRDNPPATPEDTGAFARLGQRLERSINQPEVHDVYRRWRPLADSYGPPRVLLGETYVMELEKLASFYGNGHDELHLAFNFSFLHADLDAEVMRDCVERTEAALPDGAWPVWTGSNHDVHRFPSRWAGDDPDRARCALTMLLTLRGTPVLYYGDELLLPQVELPDEALRDPVAFSVGRENGRDGERTPMPWSPEPGYGFTAPGVEPWLPFGDRAGRTVAEQRDDPGSPLHLARDLIALRRRRDDLVSGAYVSLPSPRDTWAWRRGEATVVALNLGETAAELAVRGTVLVATNRARDGERVDGSLRLGPGEAAVLDEDR